MNVFEMFGDITLKGGEAAGRQLDKFDSKGKKASKSIVALQKVSVAAGKAIKFAFVGAAAAVGLLTVGLTKAVKEAADLEQISVAYEVLIGDVVMAAKVIEDIKKKSAKTPFQFKDLAKQGQTLMAFGIAADVVVDKMMMLGDISMGNSVKMESIVRAYGKIQAKGKATLEELNMLTENGVPILEALANQYEVTTEEMFKLITTGKVGFADVDQAIRSMTAEGGQFFGMLERQSRTFTGRISTLRDNIQMLFAEVGSRLLPVLGPMIDDMTLKIQEALEGLASGEGPLAEFTEKLVRVIAWAINNVPKIGTVFQHVGIIAGLVAEGIGQVFDTVSKKVKTIIESLKIDKVFEAIFDVTIKLIGDTYAALKKGIDTGDWSDFFGITLDWAKVGLTIFATVALAKNIATVVSGLFSSITAAFLGTKFLAGIKGVGIGGVVAGVSLAISIADTIADPEKGWGALAANVGFALIGAFAAGVLTGNPRTGFMVFTVLLNFKLGEILKETATKAGEAFTEGIEEGADVIEIGADMVTAAAGWSDELSTQLADDIKTGVKRALKTFDLVGAVVDLIVIVSGDKTIATESEKIGENIGDGVISGLDSKKGSFIDTLKKWFSPVTDLWDKAFPSQKEAPVTKLSFKPGKDSAMKIGIKTGKDYGDGVIIGLNNKAESVGKTTSKLAKIANDSFIDELEDPSIIAQIITAIQNLRDALAAPGTVDADSIIKSLFGGEVEEVVDDLSTVADATETAWDRIVKAAADSGVSLVNIEKQWGKTLENMLTDVIYFVAQAGSQFITGTIDWADSLTAFESIMNNVFSSLFSVLITEIAKAIIAQDAWLLSTLANIATAIVGFLAQAFAALTAFFWFLGPGAPVAAGLVMAGAVAAIAALGFAAISLIAPSEATIPEDEEDDDDINLATGGRQISEITGPSRDLLVDLLTPLARLDSLTSIGNRIYDLLDERLVPGGSSVHIETINIEAGVDLDEESLIARLEESLGERITFVMEGNTA